MDTVEFHQRVEQTWHTIEEQLEEQDCDVDFEIHGAVMEIIFADDSRIVINKQEAMSELWLASQLGGFHFKYQNNDWVDRDGLTLWHYLEQAVAKHGETVSFQ
ncbi:iron donor protein CyaY [Phocoenobacter skyensis]|uniref:Iron-sulfur cluster assembly protein CyaY n=1 Tax=Phocoenobacter skyensis TaxID=97481 RepID=A0A1H7V0P9_9PAST|nr:iron donor protein CyaY [Pasteurella skyensis]MDP8078505.1 iron donor protein CyaY [Pasteurella skyensis]MDP8084403.1 iron donor protein CyaY [Pasteurella skyensis]MDP8161982.1 iron donor protein CyaY [Pasteurella skyensis]MDP8171044.1 iron donor protein CyaY [Pasteurella skyensis]MDP8172138.1 iron donor protein CyaY [Pasteurella skyensis]